MIRRAVALAAAMLASVASPAAPDKPGASRVRVVTSDVDRFYALYADPALATQPDAIAARYLADPSPGLREFMAMRRITPERMAAALRDKPALYRDARTCAATLGRVRTRLTTAADRLAVLYPNAIFPPITIAISRGAPVAAANAQGLYVSLEALCAAKFFEPNDENRFVHVIGHEYIHAQQPLAQVESESDTVLHAAIVEGAAEFIDEQITGSVAATHLHRWSRDREAMIETAFVAEKDGKANDSRWVYNGLGTADWPGDLGYWVGYRIVKSYYARSRDKRAALRRIIEIDDTQKFLAESGWQPGMRF